LPRAQCKKRGEPKLPPSELNRLLWLVSVLLADGWTLTERRSGTGTKVGNDERQVGHGEITRTNIADERKAVSKLEVADGERIALEGWGHCWVAESVGPNRAGRNVGSFKGCRRSVRSGGGAAVEGERGRAVLCAREVVARGERIHRGIRNRHTRVEASLIGDVRIEQNGTAHTDGQDGVRGGTAVTEARDGQGGRGRASRGARGRRSVGEGHRRRARQRRIRGGSRREGEADGEREAFDRVRVGVHHFPYRSTTVGGAVDGDFRRVVTCHGRESPAAACTVADGFTGDELGQTDVGGAIRGVGVTGEAAGIGKSYGRSDVGLRHEDVHAARDVIEGRLQTRSEIGQARPETASGEYPGRCHEVRLRVGRNTRKGLTGGRKATGAHPHRATGRCTRYIMKCVS